MLDQQHRDRVRLLAARARRHPDAHLVARGLAREQRRHLRLERVEGVAVAEEVGDADQQVLEQRAGLAGMGAQEVEVGRQLVDAVDAHAPADAAQDRRPLVVAEVAPGVGAQVGEDAAQRRLELVGGERRSAAPAAGRPRAAASAAAGRACTSTSRAGMSPTGRTQSTMPVAIAERGMPECSASSGSWAIVRPPRSLMRLMPIAPSPSAPERTIAAAFGPCVSARVRKNRSTATRRPRSGVRSPQVRWPFADDRVLPGGMT